MPSFLCAVQSMKKDGYAVLRERFVNAKENYKKCILNLCSLTFSFTSLSLSDFTA